MSDEVEAATGSDWADELLAVRAAQGEGEAFGALYDRYARRVARMLRTFAADDAELEDMVHDTFCKVMDALPSYTPRGAFRAWLFTIALNVGRKSAQRRGSSARACEEWMSHLTGHDSDTGMLPVETRLLARRLVGTLSQPKRLVVLLRLWLDLPYDEIAAILAIPPATARTRMHCALHDLRDLLARDEAEEVRTA
ncbi:MAG: RNA polymerase sigma factor [Anaerolineae bacterium]|nr:RNA polymerase sigma factor [Anaerolineae bacterium]